jgi:hypothetical protein
MAGREDKSYSMEVEKALHGQDDTPSQESEILSPEQQKKLLRRIDRRLIGITGLIYCISLMDRNNLGAAALAGMNADLNLVAYRYVS